MSCYYGSFRAVKDVSVVAAQARGDGAHRPVRLRQVDPAPDVQPDERPGPELPVDRPGPPRRPGSVRQGRRPGRRPSTRRDGLPEAEPVPQVDLRERRVRAADQRLQGQDGRARRAEPAPGGALGRGQGQAQGIGHGTVRRPAAAPVHRPDDRHRARGHPHGRAVLGARPAIDPPDRGAHGRAQEGLHDRHRHPQHAAGGPRLGCHRDDDDGYDRTGRATSSSRARRSRSSPTRRTS